MRITFLLVSSLNVALGHGTFVGLHGLTAEVRLSMLAEQMDNVTEKS